MQIYSWLYFVKTKSSDLGMKVTCICNKKIRITIIGFMFSLSSVVVLGPMQSPQKVIYQELQLNSRYQIQGTKVCKKCFAFAAKDHHGPAQLQ